MLVTPSFVSISKKYIAFGYSDKLICLVYSPLKSDRSLNKTTSPKAFKTLNFTSCVCSVEKEKLNPLLNGFGKIFAIVIELGNNSALLTWEGIDHTPFVSSSAYMNETIEFTAPFIHDHWEEVYLCEGDLIVGNDINGEGGEKFYAPTYACRPPGAYHGPFKSDDGCVMFELHYYYKPDKG